MNSTFSTPNTEQRYVTAPKAAPSPCTDSSCRTACEGTPVKREGPPRSRGAAATPNHFVQAQFAQSAPIPYACLPGRPVAATTRLVGVASSAQRARSQRTPPRRHDFDSIHPTVLLCLQTHSTYTPIVEYLDRLCRRKQEGRGKRKRDVSESGGGWRRNEKRWRQAKRERDRWSALSRELLHGMAPFEWEQGKGILTGDLGVELVDL